MSSKASGRFLRIATLTAVLITISVAAWVLWSSDDGRGYEALSRVEIGPVSWEAAPLETVVADMNRMIAESGETKFKIFLAPIAEPEPDPLFVDYHPGKVTLNLPERRPATEVGHYVAELSGHVLWCYSTPEGLLIAPSGDYRTRREKAKQWVKDQITDVLRIWKR